MRGMKRIGIILMMLVFIQQLHAEWLFLGEEDQEVEYISSEIEKGPNPGEHIVWMRSIRESPQTIQDITYWESRYCFVINKTCTKMGVSSIEFYDKNGNIIYEGELEPVKMDSQSPDSFLGEMMELVKTTLKEGRTSISYGIEKIEEIPPEKVNGIYDILSEGKNLQLSRKEFSDWFTKHGEEGRINRKVIYFVFKELGADIGDSYMDFYEWLKWPDSETEPKINPNSYYIAEVTANRLTIRNGPGTNYASDGTLSKGEEVIVAGTDLFSEGFCMVMTLDGKKFGYVSSKYLEVVDELQENVGGVLQEAGELTELRNESEIQIRNDVNQAITVQINGKAHNIASGQTITVKGVRPGKVSMIGTSKGLKPYYGTDTVKGGYVYRWTFYAKTK